MIGEYHLGHRLSLLWPVVVFDISVLEDVLVLHHHLEGAIDDQSVFLTVDQISHVGSIERVGVAVVDDPVLTFGGDGALDMLESGCHFPYIV